MSPTLAAVALLALTQAAPVEVAPHPRHLDRYGDPLPPGAVARLGSAVFRHPELGGFALPAGGTTAVTVGRDGVVRTWAIDSGRLIRAVRLAREDGSPGNVYLSPDGTTVACHVHKPSGGSPLVFWSSATGAVAHRVPVDRLGSTTVLGFSAGGVLVVAGHWEGEGWLVLVDGKTGRHREVADKRVNLVGSYGRSPVAGAWDRLRVATTGSGGVRVHDLVPVREAYRVAGAATATAFSADGRHLAVCGAGDAGPVLAVYDAGTGAEAFRVPLGKGRAYQEVAFAPDGRSAACGGASGGCLVDLATRRVRWETDGTVWDPAFDPDARTLAARDGGRLRVWDAATGRERFDRPGELGWAPALAAAPDGGLVATAARGRRAVTVWDPATGRLVRQLPLAREGGRSRDPRTVSDVRFTADGRAIVAVAAAGHEFRTFAVHRWRVDGWAAGPPGGGASVRLFGTLRPSPDGRAVAALVPRGGYDGAEVSTWDAATGRALASHARPDVPTGHYPEASWWEDKVAWSPDGRTLAVGTRDGPAVLDPVTGRDRVRLRGGVLGGTDAVLWSEDGRLVLDMRWRGVVGGVDVVVWEAETGDKVATVRTPGAYPRGLGAAGRALVAADDRGVRVLDLATGEERGRFDLPGGYGSGSWLSDPVTGLLVLPGGRRVLTALADGTGLVWDLDRVPLRRLATGADAKAVTGWWADLASEDAGKAYQAVWRLSDADPNLVVPVVRAGLKRAAVPAEVGRLVTDLNSDTFAVRDAASKRLEGMGTVAVPVLREALKTAESPEVRVRLERVLERLTSGRLVPDELRAVRAVGVLERVGTADARKLLAEWASGAAVAPQTREARSALEWLGRSSR